VPTRPEVAGVVPWRQLGPDVDVGVIDGALPTGQVGDQHPLAAGLAVARRVGIETSAPGPRLELPAAPHSPAWLWPMEVTESAAAPPLTWLPVVKAAQELAAGWQRRAAEVLAADSLRPARPVVLVRHAKAGKRGEFDGPDAERPLDPRGRAQALALVDLLTAYRPDRIVSSDARRSLETVAPLAAELGLIVEHEHLLSEDGSADDPPRAMVALRSIVEKPKQTVVSIQRKTIERLLPDLLRLLGHQGDLPHSPRKGGLIVLHMPLSEDRPVLVEELPPPEQSGSR